MDARLIQQQVLLGSRVNFFFKTGPVISGILIGLGNDYVIVDRQGKKITILLEMIGAWEVEDDEPRGPALEPADGAPVASTLEAAQLSTPAQLSEQRPPAVPQADHGAPAAPAAAPAAASAPAQLSEQRPPAAPQANHSGAAAPAPPPATADPELIKALLAIEAKYQARTQLARLEPDAVELLFPTDEIEKGRRKEAHTAWQSIKNAYDYARKINELEQKHGRIERISQQLASLAEQYPEAHSFKRMAASFALAAGRVERALELWSNTAYTTNSPSDWKQVAALALLRHDHDLCCYSLERYYRQTSIREEESAWFVWIEQIRSLGNQRCLGALLTHRADISSDELQTLCDAGIYLLQSERRHDLAERYLIGYRARTPSHPELATLFNEFTHPLSAGYARVQATFETVRQTKTESAPAERKPGVTNQKQPQREQVLRKGGITHYNDDKGYGFIRGEDGLHYFFHRNSVADGGLIQLLSHNPQARPRVLFSSFEGSRGPIAFDIELTRSGQDMVRQAHSYAEATEYHKAVAEMRNLLRIDPAHPGGQDLLARWNHFAAEKKLRETTLPKGSGYYARAKCVELVERDLERAIDLYRQAIQLNDRPDSAVKDIAMILAQLERPQEAINVLLQHRDSSRDPRSIDGMLIVLYQKIGDIDKAVPLLLQRAKTAPTALKRSQILWVIANLYLRQQAFTVAEEYFRQVLAQQPGNTIAKRHIAICLLKQDRFAEAEIILNEILEYSSDAQAAEMLAAVQQARDSGIPTDIDILISTSLSDFFTEISPLTRFFLDRCDFKGVPPVRLQAQQFNRKDVEMLDERAIKLSSRLPRDRSSFYLSAAKIESLLEDYDPNRFYRYLYRSFASMGDAIVLESGLLDSACDLYCEALTIYDNDYSANGDQQDAANALVRVLYATLGLGRIPITTATHLSIDEAIESVISQHPNPTRVFHYVAYLIYRSRYAAGRVLNRLYRSNWRKAALAYLREQQVEVSDSVNNADSFTRLWDVLRRRQFEDYRLITNEFLYLLRVDLIPSVIENCIGRLRSITDTDVLFFDLDRQRLREFHRILEIALELVQRKRFEDKERLCLQADSRCRELIREIEKSPTRLSIEQLHPIVQSLQQKLVMWLEELYQRSTPALSLRLPFDTHPVDDEQKTEVQIAIENQIGRSPAENVELVVVQDDTRFFTLLTPDLRLSGSLRGGDCEIIHVPLQLSAEALSAGAFSMTVYVQYQTRSDQEWQRLVENLSIVLQRDVEEIANPYKAYTKGGVVEDEEMFYGRDAMIASIVNTIMRSLTSKSVMLYGQKRSGKSSILFHIQKALVENPDVLVLNIENIGALLDEQAPTPLLYQILWNILRKLKTSIRRREEQGYSQLGIIFPKDIDFYTHLAPLSFFNDFFDDFKDIISRRPDWQSVRIILLIDEFSYIYGYIVRGILNEDFMKNWKALLQRNYFSVVLAGQDVMPKFIQRFPNDFGTIEDHQVGYLSSDDACALIDEPIRKGGKNGESRYRERAIDRIIELTAGSPFYIQIICSRIVEYMQPRRQALLTTADVERIKNTLIHESAGLKISDFDNLINSGDTSPDCISDSDALAVLSVIAHNTRQASTCARGEIICETEKPIEVILEDLVNRAVLERERGSYYRIRVGLFKEWLNENR